jgi:hypothetical protein
MVELQYILYILCIRLLYPIREHWNYGHLETLTLSSGTPQGLCGSHHLCLWYQGMRLPRVVCTPLSGNLAVTDVTEATSMPKNTERPSITLVGS